jgi:hypothetical protein
MNVAKTAVCLLLLLLVTVMGAGQVWGQSGAPGTKLRRVVLRDTEAMVSSASQYRTREGEGYQQCTPNGIPALELVTPPKHGTVRFVVADLGVPKGSGCMNSVYGQAILYRPAPGFVGRDRFTYDVPADPTAFVRLGPPPGPWTVFVVVRDKEQTNVRGIPRRPAE